MIEIHVGSGTWHKRILVAKYTSEKIYFLKINEVFMAQEDDTLSGTDTHNSFNKHKQRILKHRSHSISQMSLTTITQSQFKTLLVLDAAIRLVFEYSSSLT